MKFSSTPRAAILSLVILSASAFADTVVLTSGEKIEGKVTSETATEITISAKVTESITDERVIKKTEVASVTKEAPDETAWQSLKNAKLGRNSFPLANYDSAINPLKGFANEFPQSKFAAEAKKMAETFAEEKTRVEAGELKLDGKWLSKEETEKEGTQIKALIAFNYMKEQGARDMSAALNTFDAIEKSFPGTRSYPDAIEYAQKMLPALKSEVDRRSKAFAAQKQEQGDALKKMTGPEKAKLEDERKRIASAADAAASAAEKQGLKWLPLNPPSERAMKSLDSRITSETSRLAGLPVAKMRASILAAEKAQALLDGKDLAGAETALTQAAGDWANNELSTRVRVELDAAKKLAAVVPAPAVAPEPEPVPGLLMPEPATAKSDATDEATEPVAEKVESDKPFLLTAPGALMAVVVVGFVVAGLSALKKMKRKSGDELE